MKPLIQKYATKLGELHSKHSIDKKDLPQKLKELLATDEGMELFHALQDEFDGQMGEAYEEAYQFMVEQRDGHKKEIDKLINNIKDGMKQYLNLNDLEIEGFFVKVNAK